MRSPDLNNLRKKVEQENNLLGSVGNAIFSIIPKPYASDNPSERIRSGINHGFLIIFQLFALPILLLTFIIHPFLSISKAIRVIIAFVGLCCLLPIAFVFDPVIYLVWIISLGYIRTSKLIISGYTKDLYNWVTSHGHFWDLD